MFVPLVLCLAALDDPTDLPPEHAENPVLARVLAEGLGSGGASATLPAPTFRDGQDAEGQRAALRELAGSERAAAEVLRDSVTAPVLVRLRDAKGEEATIRSGDVYFVLHADLDAIDPREVGPGEASGPVEAGNMRFEARVLSADELEAAGVEPPGEGEWIVHATGSLLDRISVETTSRSSASRSGRSLVVASRSDDRFDAGSRWPNRWSTFDRRNGASGPARPYAGGVGYAKLTALEGMPGALVVEVHFAFVEPKDWFDGAPALRSKVQLVATDAVRRLRRELAERAHR
jgi:hypothetical protein